MKVLHLVAGSIAGGAGRGAYWLHQALRELGVESTLMTNSSDNGADPSVIALAGKPSARLAFALLSRLGNLPVYLYRKRRRIIFSTGFAGFDFTRHPAYASADIVHLHWINSLVGTRTLSKVTKPMVWTMRDMWPLTGGCHYAMDCRRYTLGCGQCPQLQSTRRRDLSRFIAWYKKRMIPRDIAVVGISNWLTDCARASRVFEGCAVQTIGNNIDTRIFFPVDRGQAQKALGLDTDKRIVLIGAQNVTDFYKGFDLLVEALEKIDRHDLHLCSFGRTSAECLAKVGADHTSLGFLHDNISLRLAYSAADVFVAPSRMDAFGKTIAEAMACGTPVVCFDATGPRDIVEHKVSGYKARPFEPADLADGIRWVLARPPEDYAALGASARQRVEACFDSRGIASKYFGLYEQLLQRGGDSPMYL